MKYYDNPVAWSLKYRRPEKPSYLEGWAKVYPVKVFNSKGKLIKTLPAKALTAREFNR